MASSNFHCSIRQGFNFEKDNQDRVGHIESLKIGGDELAADIQVTDPENVSDSSGPKIVGVMQNIRWEGGYGDPILFSCNVSNANYKKIATKLHTSLSDTSVEFKFSVYDYDPEKKQYYKCMHSNDVVLKGLIYKQGGSLVMGVSDEPSHEIPSPKNYPFDLGVMPADDAGEMAVHLAVSTSDKFAKQFGVPVS